MVQAASDVNGVGDIFLTHFVSLNVILMSFKYHSLLQYSEDGYIL